eukprot:gene5505-6190_t
MAELGNISLADVNRDLIISVRECNSRGLIHSASWAAELSCSLPPLDEPIMPEENIDDEFKKDFYAYSLAKTYFDMREYERAAHHLQGCKSHKAYFLYLYSMYMSGEKKKRYKMADILDSASKSNVNVELKSLQNELQEKKEKLDGYCLYLYGVVLKELNLAKKASEVLVEAVKKEPLHWGAWKELAATCKSREMLQSLDVGNHWMTEFFYALAELDLLMNKEALTRYENLSNAGFHKSTYVKQQLALKYYNLRNFEQATNLFKENHAKDPYMLNHIDTYSNVLYIQVAKSELSYLAHKVAEIDKYRYESCGVIGNYYSLRGNHEKAVLYFRQALRLNPQHIVAWTLLGHEYVELKNTSAAIESYRRATDVSPKEYRAWYGLGQTYEILKMPYYSLHYYNEAFKLRPNDPRILVALGETYHNLDKNEEAKKCFWRAFRIGDPEGQATMKLAKLHEIAGEDEDACRLYTLVLDQYEPSGFHTAEDIAKGLLFIAKHHFKKNKINEAESYARRASEYNLTREEGRSLLYEIRHSRVENEPLENTPFQFTAAP